VNSKKAKSIRQIARKYELSKEQYNTLKSLVLQAEEGKKPMSKEEMEYVLEFVGESFK